MIKRFLKIEISPSCRATCYICRKKIKRYEIRGIILGNKICNKCMNFSKIRREIDSLEKKFIELDKMSKKEKEEFFVKLKVMRKLK